MLARPEAGRRTPAEPGHSAPTGTRVRRRTGSGSPPGSSAVPQAADPRLGRCRCELGTPAALGVTPGVRLEPPALDRLHQRCHVTLLAGLFERRIQFLVVPLEDVAICIGGQHGPDHRRRAGRARQDAGCRLTAASRDAAAMAGLAQTRPPLSRGALRHWRLPAQVGQLPDSVLVAGVGRVRRRSSAPSSADRQAAAVESWRLPGLAALACGLG